MTKIGTRKGYKVPRMWLKEVRAYVQLLEIFKVLVARGMGWKSGALGVGESSSETANWEVGVVAGTSQS